MELKVHPPIPKDLLEWLEARIPDKAPSEADLTDMSRVAFKAGSVSVVRFLRHIYELQNQNILEN